MFHELIIIFAVKHGLEPLRIVENNPCIVIPIAARMHANYSTLPVFLVKHDRTAKHARRALNPGVVREVVLRFFEDLTGVSAHFLEWETFLLRCSFGWVATDRHDRCAVALPQKIQFRLASEPHITSLADF